LCRLQPTKDQVQLSLHVRFLVTHLTAQGIRLSTKLSQVSVSGSAGSIVVLVMVLVVTVIKQKQEVEVDKHTERVEVFIVITAVTATVGGVTEWLVKKLTANGDEQLASTKSATAS